MVGYCVFQIDSSARSLGCCITGYLPYRSESESQAACGRRMEWYSIWLVTSTSTVRWNCSTGCSWTRRRHSLERFLRFLTGHYDGNTSAFSLPVFLPILCFRLATPCSRADENGAPGPTGSRGISCEVFPSYWVGWRYRMPCSSAPTHHRRSLLAARVRTGSRPQW